MKLVLQLNIPGARYLVLNCKRKMNKNIVELVSMFGKIKPCGNPHGSCSDNHTPLRGEQ